MEYNFWYPVWGIYSMLLIYQWSLLLVVVVVVWGGCREVNQRAGM